MTKTERKYTPGEIDRAGKILGCSTATKEQQDHAIEVMDNWRLSHAYPMETARKTLESRAKSASHSPTFGTRLKTEGSIRAKLIRERRMKLSTMQDIGGCRVILRDMDEVNRLVDLYARDSGVNIDDYVKEPRVSGYRGKHMIWRFAADDERHSCYNNMRIEIQIRTELQHSWATAVEVCSTFTDQNLKSDHPVCNDPRWCVSSRWWAVRR
jgi:ppGpp synthetase/RelA/SpoT-type nucleotidyltranferase